jgi:hypothetical protein
MNIAEYQHVCTGANTVRGKGRTTPRDTHHLKFRVAGHPRTDGVELRLLQRWGSGRTPSWFTTIWAA